MSSVSFDDWCFKVHPIENVSIFQYVVEIKEYKFPRFSLLKYSFNNSLSEDASISWPSNPFLNIMNGFRNPDLLIVPVNGYSGVSLSIGEIFRTISIHVPFVFSSNIFWGDIAVEYFMLLEIFLSGHIFEEPNFNHTSIIHGDPFDCQEVFINYLNSTILLEYSDVSTLEVFLSSHQISTEFFRYINLLLLML